MSTTRPLAVLIGGAVGGVAAVLAYGVLAPSAGSDAIASVSSVSPAAAEVVYDPCVAPAVLEGDTCVTRVTVTKPAAVAMATTRKAAPVSAIQCQSVPVSADYPRAASLLPTTVRFIPIWTDTILPSTVIASVPAATSVRVVTVPVLMPVTSPEP